MVATGALAGVVEHDSDRAADAEGLDVHRHIVLAGLKVEVLVADDGAVADVADGMVGFRATLV